MALATLVSNSTRGRHRSSRQRSARRVRSTTLNRMARSPPTGLRDGYIRAPSEKGKRFVSVAAAQVRTTSIRRAPKGPLHSDLRSRCAPYGDNCQAPPFFGIVVQLFIHLKNPDDR